MSLPEDGAARRKLPIGIQTFREIREEGYYYVDKTAWVRRLVDGGKYYFLSRPRRFGKSLLLDTMKELFEGREELFRGLAIHDRWDWNVRCPVVRLDFGSGNYKDPDWLKEDVTDQLGHLEESAGVDARSGSGPARLRHFVRALHESAGERVVVLVDEYDKPILDALEAPKVARANRDYLRGLYSTLKSSDAHIKFALLTGVSKFSKVSIFSGLNNLIDITLDPGYSAVCGYTDGDLDTVFAPELPGLDREEIRHWYNGYCWRGNEKVYNPFDVLLLFRSREYKAHWFETSSPKFLIDALMHRRVSTLNLDRMTGDEALLSAFDLDAMAIEALLFQTGYLTVLDHENRNGVIRYRLGYPNREVRQSLNEHLLMALLPDDAQRLARDGSLRELLAARDFAGLEASFRSIFAGIPYQWRVKNDIQEYEGYYASVVYSCFAAQGLDLIAEESSSTGRADMTVRLDDHIYVFEFKPVRKEATGEALAQLKEKGYADKYRRLGQTVHLIGVEFSREDRNVAAFEVASHFPMSTGDLEC